MQSCFIFSVAFTLRSPLAGRCWLKPRSLACESSCPARPGRQSNPASALEEIKQKKKGDKAQT